MLDLPSGRVPNIQVCHRGRRRAESDTLIGLLERYRDEVTHLKKGPAPDSARIRALLRHPLAQRILAGIRGVDVASYSDDRLNKFHPPLSSTMLITSGSRAPGAPVANQDKLRTNQHKQQRKGAGRPQLAYKGPRQFMCEWKSGIPIRALSAPDVRAHAETTPCASGGYARRRYALRHRHYCPTHDPAVGRDCKRGRRVS